MDKYLDTYKNKKILITGHTGFKGSWLTIWLKSLGADIIGIAKEPRSKKDNYVLSDVGKSIRDFRADIRDLGVMQEIFDRVQPEILFHLAAQPIVLDSYQDPVYTFETNILGTVNVLEAFRKCSSLHTGIFITSDKCYDNKEWVWGYRESDPLGGHDPYSASKGAAEIVIDSYRRSFFAHSGKNVASVRAGNVIGGGDWSPHRIVVDCIKSIESNEPIEIRNPKATRPWQHVLEPLGGYLLLGAKMMHEKGKYAEAWNFGPNDSNLQTVEKLVKAIIREYGTDIQIKKSNKHKFHEAGSLGLDIRKCKQLLNWSPVLNFQETVKFTVDWYKNYHKDDVFQLCLKQIRKYINKWK